MGGQNHQPTNQVRLIAPSVWLSQRIGDGFSHVLRANSELENAIIAGMDHLHVEGLAPHLPLSAAEYLDVSISHLETSLATISDIEIAYANLLAAADAENYRGNPLASKVATLGLAGKFEGGLVSPSINRAAWDELESRVADQNILKTLAWEATRFGELREPTAALIEVLQKCRAIATTEGS